MTPQDTIPFTTIAERITRILDEGSVAALITLIAAPANVGAKLLVDQDGGRLGTLGDDQLDAAVVNHAPKFLYSNEETESLHVKGLAPELSAWNEAQLLFERVQREPRIVVCGAGHVGAALARLASVMGFHSTLVDDRAEFVKRERFPERSIDLVHAENWSDAVRAAVGDGRGVSVAIVTRGHSEDETCLRAVMVTGASYVGLIGSKRRTNIVLERLRESGVSEERLQPVRAPIGLDIGAVTPEEVALAILAEIVAERRGGLGGPLSAWRRKERETSAKRTKA
jgi:xanthine dehydrogenase accessory factor